jgi:hypothetical protein
LVLGKIWEKISDRVLFLRLPEVHNLAEILEARSH